MRKLVAMLSLAAVSFGAVAQKADIVSAVLEYNKKNIANAKKFIDRATPNPDLGEKNLSKYWYYRGKIYYAIAVSPDSSIRALDNEPVEKAYESFREELKVDVKERYSKKDIRESIWNCALVYLNRGYDKIEAYEDLSQMPEAEAAEAVSNLIRATEIKEDPIIGRVDSSTIYTASIVAQYAKDYDQAIALANRVIELGYKNEFGYFNLINIYKSLDQLDKALEVIQDAKVAYPNSIDILVEEVNIYIAKGQTEKAIEPLKAAVQNNPDNAMFHATLGSIFNNIGQYQNAENSLKKAVELDETLADAWYQLGFLSVEKANALVEKMNASGVSQSKFNAYKKEQTGHYKAALPYFEKALELDPENLDTMEALKVVYYKLDMYPEMKAIKAKISALTGK